MDFLPEDSLLSPCLVSESYSCNIVPTLILIIYIIIPFLVWSTQTNVTMPRKQCQCQSMSRGSWKSKKKNWRKEPRIPCTYVGLLGPEPNISSLYKLPKNFCCCVVTLIEKNILNVFNELFLLKSLVNLFWVLILIFRLYWMNFISLEFITHDVMKL